MDRSSAVDDPGICATRAGRVREPYKNPRKLPEKWVEAYLQRDREMLALDAMRAFDEIASLKAKVQRYRVINIALTSILTGLAWEGVKVFFAFLFP